MEGLFEGVGLQSQLRAFMEGACTAIVVMGGAESRKTRTFSKLVPLCVEQLFQMLKSKKKK